MNKNCLRCANPFDANPLLKGENVCRTCDRMNDITFWYPRLHKLSFPMPQTEIIYSGIDFERISYGDLESQKYEIGCFIQEIRQAMIKVGLPAFLRTGYTSNKHDWKQSCYVSVEDCMSDDKLLGHIVNLVEHSGIMTIDRFTPCDFWAVREMLDTEVFFKAFQGNMPITKERRYFVRNGMVECHHSYWPDGVFKNLDKKAFDKLSEFTKEDEVELNKMAGYIAKVFHGYWSCDFLQDKKGNWWLTDMAIGEQSYHEKH